jgi:hypothetical protein
MAPREAAKAAWSRVPAWARWPLAYAAALALCLLVAALTPLDVGGALFLGGAAGVFASAAILRTGGHRKVVTLRAPDGTPLKREPLPPEARRREVRLGVGVFLLALGLWALLPVTMR